MLIRLRIPNIAPNILSSTEEKLQLTCWEIWTKRMPLMMLSMSRTEPMEGGWIWMGGRPPFVLPWINNWLYSSWSHSNHKTTMWTYQWNQRWKSQRIKNTQARLQIFYRFLNPKPRVRFSFWKSQTFAKSIVTFGFADFLLEFWKSIGWYGFSEGLLVVLNVFHQCFVKSYY